MNVVNQGAGIDYSNGLANRDLETGIHYGVIPLSAVLQAWADESEAVTLPRCPKCGEVLRETLPMIDTSDLFFCPVCVRILTEEEDYYCETPDYWWYECNGYKCHQGGDDTDIFLEKSPFYTYCKFCSPCAPGAGYLLDFYRPNKHNKEQLTLLETISGPEVAKENLDYYAQCEGYIRAYCFGADWFEDEKPPYPIWEVGTNKRVC